MLFVFPAVGAVLTAFYMFRMWFLTFAGEPRGFPSKVEAVHSHVHDEEHALDKEHGPAMAMATIRNPAAHAHESEPIMTWPLIILAVCSIFSGWTLFYVLPLPSARRRWNTCSNMASHTGRSISSRCTTMRWPRRS